MNANRSGAALLLDGRLYDDPTLVLAHDALAAGRAAGGGGGAGGGRLEADQDSRWISVACQETWAVSPGCQGAA